MQKALCFLIVLLLSCALPSDAGVWSVVYPLDRHESDLVQHDLVYRGEHVGEHDLVYRGEPIEVLKLKNE